MEVIRAHSAGFCWGVERAIEMARGYAQRGRLPVYTDGPLIHNRQMMARLEAEGIREVGDYSSTAPVDLKGHNSTNAVLVVRAHGISPERRQYLKSLGLEFRDATCPDVGIIAGKIRVYARKGYATVIFGDPLHPEITGLLGYTEGRGQVVSCLEDVDRLPSLDERVLLVSQSTMFTDDFLAVAARLRERYPEAVILDTICQATKERQGDVRTLVEQGAQALVVIGGHHSANTRKLAFLARQTGLPTHHLETAAEIVPEDFARYEKVGVTAGASTPEFIIAAVCERLASIPTSPAESSATPTA